MKPRLLRIWYSHRDDTQSCPQAHEAELLKLWRTGAFNYLGIQCKATILFSGRRITLSSEGQWGIRSDHRLGIETAELVEGDQLRATLRQIGCGERAVIHAMAKATRMGTNTGKENV